MQLIFEIPDGAPVEEIERGLKLKLDSLLKRLRPKRPNPGRPPQTPEQKNIAARGRMMLKYFDRLKEQLDAATYATHFAQAEEALRIAIRTHDEYMISGFEFNQPWTKRR